jgi:hypothetical protein
MRDLYVPVAVRRLWGNTDLQSMLGDRFFGGAEHTLRIPRDRHRKS